MKLSYLLFILSLAASSCNSQQSNLEKAKQTQKAIAAARPGTVPTNAGSWTLTATMDGKNWKAESMYPPDEAARIIGYIGNSYISLPNIQRQFAKVGEKKLLGENNAVDVNIDGDPAFYAGKNGEMVITKMEGDWIEGTFFFTATSSSSSKKIVVTNGFFKVKYTK
ncbi:MAG: hypothetical protein ABW007_08690 [Chitinophagaceae bacterium]